MLSFCRLVRKLLVALALAACSKSEPAAPAPAAAPAVAQRPAIDSEAARQLIAQEAVVIDVRTADEFASGHVRRATNIPVDELANRLTEVDALVYGDKHSPIVVYCSKGVRSARAKTILEGAGHLAVINGGGYDDLQ
jgi:phage shock protein E